MAALDLLPAMDRFPAEGSVRNRVVFELSAKLPENVCTQVKLLTVEASPYIDRYRVRLEFKNGVRCRFWFHDLGDAATQVKITLAATASPREKEQPLLDI